MSRGHSFPTIGLSGEENQSKWGRPFCKDQRFQLGLGRCLLFFYDKQFLLEEEINNIIIEEFIIQSK